MILHNNIETITFNKNNTEIQFLPTGDIYQLRSGDILINQMLGNTLSGSLNNIYLRIYKKDGTMAVAPLLGINSDSTFKYSENRAHWEGNYQGIDYEVVFSLIDENLWTWEVKLKGHGEEVDLLYTQDLGLANKGAVNTNELYMSQYIDHCIMEGSKGYVAMSRQTQSQGGRHPYIQQGSLNKRIIGYGTDAMQFFGTEYKNSHKAAMIYSSLPNENYQYELAFTALQTERFIASGDESAAFYGYYKENHEKAVTDIEFSDIIFEIYRNVSIDQEDDIKTHRVKLSDAIGTPYSSESLTKEEIDKYFPERILEEFQEDKLLAFFLPEHKHVVLKEKEVMVQRPHGHIITTAINKEEIDKELITSNNYMYGLFNGQIAVGNTSLNKLLSCNRGLLNVLKSSGQRIYIKLQGVYRILTMPAAYEIGMNYARWFYKINDDMLLITVYAAKKAADIILEVSSEKKKKYDFLITNQLVMGTNEYEQPCRVEVMKDKLVIRPEENTFLHNSLPELHYNLCFEENSLELIDDSIFYEDGQQRNETLLTLEAEGREGLQLIIQGRLHKENSEENKIYKFEEELQEFNSFYQEITGGFKLSLEKEGSISSIDKLNEIFWWYTHNALTHYAVPHGLEQSSGAAWGTRDVCQGPVEYFLATQNFSLTRKIILEVYKHQFLETGEWPQWFMFDNYNMQQDDSHGDVVFWPLKVLGDYIAVTGDSSILKERIEYRHFPHGAIASEESLIDHVKKAIESIEKRFLGGTKLISYAGGDWDDTLQPANKDLRDKLVSTWTMALAYQAIEQLGRMIALEDNEYGQNLSSMAVEIKKAFDTYLIKDGIIPGFIYFEDENNIEYMLHPEDKKTGINYRLLPMTRSIISELVDEEQANKNINTIKEKLTFPDGVRLMNRPANYEGGVIKFFQRAEQAANVGREIGLQYVHAHIRYIEAMCKAGRPEDAWKGLFTINPINLKDEVENAELRQSNTYFSSSDGDFKDRYDFQKNFHKLMEGEVKVKGGWRIYSSGPGIYLNQLITNVLGIRFENMDLVLDPVIPKDLDGLEFEYIIYEKRVKLVYRVADGKIKGLRINGQDTSFQSHKNLYRSSGVRVKKEDIEEKLTSELNTIEI
ncbi:MAG: GH36-type glycosyl hydrolase domain-containing protein, partial [Clostridiaceae bacterium]